LHPDVFLGGHVAADDKHAPDMLRDLGHVLAGARLVDLLHDAADRVVVQASLAQRALKERAGVLERDLPSLVVDVARIGQREHRLAAVTLAARDRGDGPGWCDSQASAVADAVLLDSRDDLGPVQGRATPIVRVRHQRLRRLPCEVVRVINAARNRGEGAALLGQRNAGPHGVEAHELDHLAGEFLPLDRAIAYAEQVHHVSQPHDPQPDPPHAEGRFLQLRHGGHIGIRRHDIVEETRRTLDRGAQFVPVHAIINNMLR
jgi:hypothetical protein